jgi:hypothetical protein
MRPRAHFRTVLRWSSITVMLAAMTLMIGSFLGPWKRGPARLFGPDPESMRTSTYSWRSRVVELGDGHFGMIVINYSHSLTQHPGLFAQHGESDGQIRQEVLAHYQDIEAVRNDLALIWGARASQLNVTRFPDWQSLAPGCWFFSIPLWQLRIVFVILAACCGLVAWTSVRPVPTGHCRRCRYDLRGLPTSSNCPECGAGSTPN